MRAIVINLDSSIERLEFQSEQLTRLSIPFTKLRAVSIEDISEQEYQEKAYDWERPLRKSELACFLSHYKAWESVLKENTPSLILEDDALLSDKTPKILSCLFNNQTNTYDLVSLETRSRKKLLGTKKIPLTSHFYLRALYQDRTGAAGYILWPSGAKKLLKKYNTHGAALADAFISSAYELNSYQTDPAAIIQLDQCDNYKIVTDAHTTSTISCAQKPKNTDLNHLKLFMFKFRRIFSQMKMGLRQLSKLTAARREYIKAKPSDFSHETLSKPTD